MGKIVTLGEIMLRLSTPDGKRISQSEDFAAHYGGGEANVAISLANFGHQAAFASKVPDNPLGEAVQKHLQKYGVDTRLLLKGGNRLGTYYVETGSGERAAAVFYDRAGSSFAELEQLEWELTDVFADAEIFHVSGITPALSDRWQEMTLDLIQQAKAAGCKVSFDINYRGKLWSQQKAGEMIRKVLPFVDYCSAGKMDALYLLGISAADKNEENDLLYYYQQMQKFFPNIQVFYSTKRVVKSASCNLLTGTLWQDDSYYESQVHHIEPIVDRVGGGDAFSGGILHGLLTEMTPQQTIDFAAAASALKHTVHGDCNQFNVQEVQRFLAAGSGKIDR